MSLPLMGEEVLSGHSMHGEVFNEGPRQAAVLMEGMGKVNFPVSTKSAEAQRFFNQGVGQLHGFWYYEAERSFRQVAKLDRDCAMAYWGCAMANVNHPRRAKGFMEQAMKRRDRASAREQRWLDALQRFYDEKGRDAKARHLGFIEDLETIVQEEPEDVEAKAFLAWAIWKSKDGGVPMVSRESVDAILREVLTKEPMHPAHHYRIHLWDTGKAKQALDSAVKCGQAAPGIAHMWHMPAHTYTKTNRLAESAWAQDAALRVDHAYIARTRVLADQIHNYAHNAEWLIRVWNEQGRVAESVALAENLLSMPRHPVGNTLEKRNSMASYGRTRLLETLQKFELWDELLVLDGSPLLDVTLNRAHEVARLRALGVAAFFKQDTVRLAKFIGMVEVLQKAAVREKEGEKKKREKGEKGEKGKKEQGEKSSNEELALAELRFLQGMLEGQRKEELAKVLAGLSGVPNDRMARYWLRVGELGKAQEYAEKVSLDAAGLGLKLEVLLKAGKKEEAEKMLLKAGEVASTLDEDLPVSGRLDEAVVTLGLDGWRKEVAVLKGEGRPELGSLGPIHWQPVRAEKMAVRDGEGKKLDLLSVYEGKPVLVLWYLGGECSHCVSQLQAFYKVRAKFREAGVEVVAIGYEGSEELVRTAKLMAGVEDVSAAGELPLFADEKLEAFKAWRCYDDFEGSALHGTFLIDGKGLVRWQDIGYEPFENTTFLLAEVKRLLALP